MSARAFDPWNAARPYLKGGPGPVVILVVKGERNKAADAGLAAMAAGKTPFYQRDGRLVRVCLVKAKNADGDVIMVPGIAPVTPAILSRELALAAQWERLDARSKRSNRIDPPPDVVAQIMDLVEEWPFPPLSGVICCPTLRRDGSILDAEGYDERTGLVMYSGISMQPIPPQPTREDAQAAVELLFELLAEVPFVNDASKSVALSQLMTPVLRGAMTAAPMHLNTAPEAGTGKSYLSDLASAIATGERAAVIAASKRDETEKRLVGAALAGYPIIALDNCRDVLEGDFLCQITERPLLQLRALGKSDKHRVANSFSVFANGNNIVVADDMVRRTIICALDANMESPETREFKHNPVAAVMRDRGSYVRAVLVVARAYIVAKKPDRLRPLASYEGWSDFVRSPLVWLGFRDPVETMESSRSADPVRQGRAALFTAWCDELGTDQAYLVSEIIERATARYSYNANLARPALNAILVEKCQKLGALGGQISPERLGRLLAEYKNTIAAGVKLIADDANRKRVRYRIRPV
jgi:putative DNA primase/helicase